MRFHCWILEVVFRYVLSIGTNGSKRGAHNICCRMTPFLVEIMKAISAKTGSNRLSINNLSFFSCLTALEKTGLRDTYLCNLICSALRHDVNNVNWCINTVCNHNGTCSGFSFKLSNLDQSPMNSQHTNRFRTREFMTFRTSYSKFKNPLLFLTDNFAVFSMNLST